MYKAQLTHWHGEGLPKAVAVKTLKGVLLYTCMHHHIILHPSNPHCSDKGTIFCENLLKILSNLVGVFTVYTCNCVRF